VIVASLSPTLKPLRLGLQNTPMPPTQMPARQPLARAVVLLIPGVSWSRLLMLRAVGSSRICSLSS
jgi:hypothetical protein